jgi:hypothetical protein
MRRWLALGFVAMTGCSTTNVTNVTVVGGDAGADSAPPATTNDAAIADGATAGDAGADDASFPDDATAVDAGPANATVSGTFQGATFAAAGGVAELTYVATGPHYQDVNLVIADTLPTCPMLGSYLPNGGRSIEITMLVPGVDGGAPQVAPGTFLVGGTSGTAQISLREAVVGCKPEAQQTADGTNGSSGSVTFTAADEVHVAGSFTVTWPNAAGAMSGTFDVPVCAADAIADAGADGGACN